MSEAININTIKTMILSSIVHQQYKVKINQQDTNPDYIFNKLSGINGIKITQNFQNNKLNINLYPETEKLPFATASTTGIVLPSTGFNIDNESKISVPYATKNDYGIITVNDNDNYLTLIDGVLDYNEPQISNRMLLAAYYFNVDASDLTYLSNDITVSVSNNIFFVTIQNLINR